MREKYESLQVKDLRALAEIRGIKVTSKMTKADLVDAMCAKDLEEELASVAKPVSNNSGRGKRSSSSETKGANAKGKKQEADEEKKPVATKQDKSDDKADKTNTKASADKAAKAGVKAMADKAEKADTKASADKAEKAGTKASTAKTGRKSTKAAATDEMPKNADATLQDKESAKSVEAGAQKAATDDDIDAMAKEIAAASQKTQASANKKDAGLKGKAADAFKEDKTFEDEKNIKDDKTNSNASESNSQSGESGATKSEPAVPEGPPAHGILEVMQEGYAFIRCENYMPGENDVYVAPGIIRRYGLKTGDILEGITKQKSANEKFSALLSLKSVNGFNPDLIPGRPNFEDLTPIFPNSRIKLETSGASVAMRVMDLLSPVGKGQRGLIVSPPKAGKTTLLKEVAKSVQKNHPDIHMIILLIDERPEEVTDIKEAIEGPNVEVIYSTFDELPEHHKRVSEMVIGRAKRLVEHHKDVMILLDSITRLTRAYNLTVPPSGRTLSGGLDPAALHMPKRFFGAARNMREGGSLTILATALVDTGSKMDDVVYEEFKGTGNMEMVLDRKLSEKRIFPAIDIAKSGTRRDDLLLSKEEIDAVNNLRRGINGLKPDESVDRILDMFSKTRTNRDFILTLQKMHIF